MSTIFRIDDVSVNTDMAACVDIVQTIRNRVPGVRIMMAFSPMVHDMKGEPVRDRQRAFPRKLSAMSDHRELFRVKVSGLPSGVESLFDIPASHGLVHVDHRLMGREAQELSIITSCSLYGTSVFVPPFNKYNKDTISICDEHDLDLVRFEDGWQHVNYNAFDKAQPLYYLHTHDTNVKSLDEWFNR